MTHNRNKEILYPEDGHGDDDDHCKGLNHGLLHRGSGPEVHQDHPVGEHGQHGAHTFHEECKAVRRRWGDQTQQTVDADDYFGC